MKGEKNDRNSHKLTSLLKQPHETCNEECVTYKPECQDKNLNGEILVSTCNACKNRHKYMKTELFTKRCRYSAYILFSLTISFIVGIVISLVICDIFKSNLIESSSPSESSIAHSLYLPCEPGAAEYCPTESPTAHVNLLNIILTEHVGRKKRSTEDTEKDGNRPILNQRFSEMYFVNKPNNTGDRLSLYAVKYSQNQKMDMESIAVPTSGIFVVFVSIEHCFRSLNRDVKHVTAKIIRHSGTEKSVIYQKSIKAIKGVGSLAYVPVKGFFPIRLEGNDTLTLEMQETGSMYGMKVGNVFGLQEVVSKNEHAW